jgi:hypothetical protein
VTDEPLLRVGHGASLDPHEVAALTTLLMVRRAAAAQEPGPARPARRPLHPWVMSGLEKGTRTRA